MIIISEKRDDRRVCCHTFKKNAYNKESERDKEKRRERDRGGEGQKKLKETHSKLQVTGHGVIFFIFALTNVLTFYEFHGLYV